MAVWYKISHLLFSKPLSPGLRAIRAIISDIVPACKGSGAPFWASLPQMAAKVPYTARATVQSSQIWPWDRPIWWMGQTLWLCFSTHTRSVPVLTLLWSSLQSRSPALRYPNWFLAVFHTISGWISLPVRFRYALQRPSTLCLKSGPAANRLAIKMR